MRGAWVLCVLLLAGCASPSRPAAAPSPSLPPATTGAASPASPTPTPAHLPVCAASSYRLSLSQDGATGSTAVGVRADGGGAPCWLRLPVRLAVVDGRGALVRMGHNGVAGLLEGAVGRGTEGASLLWSWSEPFCPSVRGLRLQLTSAAGTISQPVDVAPRCDPTWERGSGPGLSLVHT